MRNGGPHPELWTRLGDDRRGRGTFDTLMLAHVSRGRWRSWHVCIREALKEQAFQRESLLEFTAKTELLAVHISECFRRRVLAFQIPFKLIIQLHSSHDNIELDNKVNVVRRDQREQHTLMSILKSSLGSSSLTSIAISSNVIG